MNYMLVSMAEINERASVSQPSSPPPGPTHEISQLAEEAHDKLAALLQSQIASTVEEYKVIEEMNKLTTKRYEDMKVVAEGVGVKLKKLDVTYETLRPYLRQVDELDEGTRRLEDALNKMENYVTNLEQKLSTVKQAREQRE